MLLKQSDVSRWDLRKNKTKTRNPCAALFILNILKFLSDIVDKHCKKNIFLINNTDILL